MKAIRPLLSLVIAMSLAPIAVAQAPATDAPVPTREFPFPGDSLEIPLSEAFPGLDDPLSYDLDNPDILTRDGESYSSRREKLYNTMKPLCHVATLSPSLVVAQTCQTQKSDQVANWKRFFAALGKLRNPKTSSSITAQQWTDFDVEWTKTLNANTSDVYFIDSGKGFFRQTVNTVRTGSISPALPVSFNPPCKFPATPNGKELEELCFKSIPVDEPFDAKIKGNSNNGYSLHLARLQKEPAQAFVSLRKKITAESAVDAQKEAPPRVLINLAAKKTLKLTQETGCYLANTGKSYLHRTTLTPFRSRRVPFSEKCERVSLTCNSGTWVTQANVDVQTVSETCTVDPPKSCDFKEWGTVAHGGTKRLYKLDVVDSSNRRTCSESTNMLTLGCSNGQPLYNGQTSAPIDLKSFSFSTCTARPMPKCEVIDNRTQPAGKVYVIHGDTREVFTSATAPRGSNCASVKKTAQCLNGRMWVDGVAKALFTPFYSDCTDPAPVGPGGNAPGYDGHCETEELPDVEGQDPVYVPKCTDPDCSGKGPCPEGPGTNGSAEDCTDGSDNDGDGLTDCADPDCAYAIECNEDPEPDCYCENLDRELSQSVSLFDLYEKELRAAEMAAKFYRRRSETSPNAETQSQYSLAQARADRIRRSLLEERRRMDLLAQRIEWCREVSSPAKRECFEQCDEGCAGWASTCRSFLRMIYHDEVRLWDAKLQIEEISARPMTLSSRDWLDSLNRGVLEISANITALKKKLEETIDQYFECRATLPPGCRDTNWISRDDETIPDPPL